MAGRWAERSAERAPAQAALLRDQRGRTETLREVQDAARPHTPPGARSCLAAAAGAVPAAARRGPEGKSSWEHF